MSTAAATAPATSPSASSPATLSAGIDDATLGDVYARLGVKPPTLATDPTPAAAESADVVPPVEPEGEPAEPGTEAQPAEGETTDPATENQEPGTEAPIPAPAGITPEAWQAIPDTAKPAVTAALADVEALRTEKAALANQLAEAQAKQTVQINGVNPLLLVEDPAKITEMEAQLAEAQSWCVNNWDGYEGKGTPDDPSFTAAEIRARYNSIQETRNNVLPLAKQKLEMRRQSTAALKEFAALDPIYAGIANPAAPEHQILQNTLRAIPELRLIPNYQLVIADALLGAKVRNERLAAKSAGRSPSAAATAKPATRPAPKVPMAPASAPKGSPLASSRPTGTPSVKSFVKNGGDHRALVGELMKAGVI